MSRERSFRGDRDGRTRPYYYNWLAPARERDIPEADARALYEQARRQAELQAGNPDRAVEAIYLKLLDAHVAANWRPSPGKVTRTMRLLAEQNGIKRRSSYISPLTGQPIAPGKVTLTSYLTPPADARAAAMRNAEPTREELIAQSFRALGLPMPDDLQAQLDSQLDPQIDQAELADNAAGAEALAEPGGLAPEPLPEAVRSRMEQAFGENFADVRVHAESPEATGSIRALTRGREIHFRAGTYAPGTPEGDRLIAHELAHVVQQTARPGQSADRRALESEADLAASAFLTGGRAPVLLGASMGAALAFSDSEDHELADEQSAPAGMDAASAAAAAPDKAAAEGFAPEAATVPETAEPKGAGKASEMAGPEGADTASEAAEPEGAAADDAALLADIRTSIPADAAPAAGAPGGGGGGEAAEGLEAEAPEIAGVPPEQGLTALQGVRPDRLAGALGGVCTAASSEAGSERDALVQDPPEQMSTGEDVAEPVPGAESAEGMGGADAAAQPGETGDVAAAGQEQQSALEQAETATETPAVTAAPPPPVDAASTPAVENAPADENSAGGGMSDADIDRMSDSLDALPTSDPYASTDPGPAPDLAVSDEADASAEAKRAALDTTVTGTEDAAAVDIAQPMGEDHIAPTLVPETLAADFTAAAAAAEAGSAVAEAGAALGAARAQTLGNADETAGIIAHIEKRAEIDAALAEAQAQVAAERQAHTQRQDEERIRVDEEIAALKTQAEADQAKAREDAQAEVEQARADWQAEVNAQAAAARADADTEISAGMADIEAEQVRANAEAQRHIDDGKANAEAEQTKGEEEAERIKEDKEEESGGFFGWLASRAQEFFEGVKQAISDALDAARQAIQRVIDEAKRLAVEVIEAARQFIVDTIKAVGDALIAIADVLLAAFPELRERFRETIQGLVDGAVAAVNELAETLKEDVQKALDSLGGALLAGLDLLEKGLHAIVDGVSAVVQGAISFAKGMVEMVGAFAVLIKDIAGDPGGWLGKLGAAVMDGIQNHLWGALTTAVLAWFQDKVLELLGIGGIIVQLLAEGGLDLGQITSMAWEALQTALPAALIAILIEKLVAMVVPAAGAVMAILEGLQAAWGTVSRIIAAFGAFVSFLQAVKTGSAGPLFANLLAMAAVVVIDFVSNWLLRKLASAARKVGAKLKNLAERFRRRFRGKAGKGRPDDASPDAPRQDPNQRPRSPEDEEEKESPEARKARELPVALAAAKGIAEAQERMSSPVSAVLSSLRPLKQQYPWIQDFQASPTGATGTHEIWLIASKHKVTNYEAKRSDPDKYFNEINARNRGPEIWGKGKEKEFGPDERGVPDKYRNDPRYHTLTRGDLASGGKVEPKSRVEAIAAMQAMDDQLVGNLERPKSGIGDFVEHRIENGKKIEVRWDVKSEVLNPYNPEQYKEDEIRDIAQTLVASSNNYNIILDLSYFDADDAKTLFNFLKQEKGFDPKKFAITRGEF